MKVFCATQSMSGSFRPHFPGMGVIGTVENMPSEMDLLIMTGGEDVNPSRYRATPRGAAGWNDARDAAEFTILDVAASRFPDLKILGVCRGMQLINVYFGGNLHQDIETNLGYDHPGLHPIEYTAADHPLMWLTAVNSLHHQGLNRLGAYSPQVIAVEPRTRVPEIVAWNEQSLGVQFHPEMFSEERGTRFFQLVKDWVENKVEFYTLEAGESEEDEEDDEDHDNDFVEEPRTPTLTPNTIFTARPLDFGPYQPLDHTIEEVRLQLDPETRSTFDRIVEMNNVMRRTERERDNNGRS